MRDRIMMVVLLTLAPLAVLVADGDAAVGDVIQTINLPAEHRGISIAKDCAGNLYYTNATLGPCFGSLPCETELYKIRISDTYFFPPTDIISDLDQPLQVNSLAWDESGGFLWAFAIEDRDFCEGLISMDNSRYRLDPATGHAGFDFTDGGSG